MRRLNAVLLVPAVLVSIMGSHVPLAQEAIKRLHPAHQSVAVQAMTGW